MNGWYYKSLGLEVGPVSMENLIDLVKDQSLSRDDEVRFGTSGKWRRIGTIGSLMAHLPFATPVPVSITNERPATSSSEAQKSASSNWYYKSLGLEFGPVSMEKLVELVKDRSLSRQDEVRFGDEGNWRRIGTIGPLMAHLPFESATITPTKKSNNGVLDESLENDHPTDILDSLDFNTLEDFEQDELTFGPTAITTPAPASEPAATNNSTSRTETKASRETSALWWCTVQGKEYGPIDLPKMIEWAASGRLRRDDHVRYGQEPYQLASDIPGVFPDLPKSGSKPTVDVVDRPAKPKPLASKPTTPDLEPGLDVLFAPPEKTETAPKPNPAPAIEKPAPAPAAKTPPKPVSTIPSKPFTAPVAAKPSFTAPPAPAMKASSFTASPAKASRSSSIDLGALMKILIPVGIGVVVLAGIGCAIYFGPSMIPVSNSQQTDQFKSLNTAYTEFAQFRGSNSGSTDETKKAQQKLIDVTSPIILDLDKIQNRSNNQTNISRLAKKMMQVGKEELTKTKSRNEMEVETLLKVAAAGLGVK